MDRLVCGSCFLSIAGSTAVPAIQDSRDAVFIPYQELGIGCSVSAGFLSLALLSIK